LSIADNGLKHAWNVGLYLQDEWVLTPDLTFNYGVRYDEYSAFSKENQVSPRANLVWKPGGNDDTVIHVGYSRYFSPPPYELVDTKDIAVFDNTTSAADHTDSTPKAERADYYDAGITHKLTDQISIGVDSYFKSDSNLLDEGQFGAPIILTPFNYQTGRQYGAELTTSYVNGNFSAYMNASYERAAGRTITSSQFQFDPGDLAYIADHYIPLDHQQIVSLSGGAAYNWDGTNLSLSLLYGSGLRRDGATPNGDSVPDYLTVNLGASHRFDTGALKGFSVRFDVINVGDEQYEIRDGTGVGVGAPQFGARRGFFVGISHSL
jgi:outer membrane receptor protein involved in Fe transport